MDWVEGNNSDTEQWIPICTEVTEVDVQEWSGLDKGQVKNTDREIRRAVEAMREEQQERIAAQEHGKKVRYTEEEKEAQEAREWQERFMEIKRRAQEARGEEWREQEEEM